MDFSKLIGEFKSGKPIIVFDSQEREGEADIVIHASFCTPQMIRLLRKDAGGLVCLATSKEVADALGIELMAKRMGEAGLPIYRKLAIKKTAYGDMPSFSIYINSRQVRTGITDNDRSKTIMEFEGAVAQKGSGADAQIFAERFCAPGHVPLLISQGIEKRKGHTEMSVGLCKKAGMSPAAVVCEMLGDGKALSLEDARKYAKRNGFCIVEGKELLAEIGKKTC